MFYLEEIKEEEIGGFRVLVIKNPQDWPPVYQKRVLEKGCKGLLQMSFVQTEENCLTYYQIDSYEPLLNHLERIFSNKRKLHSNPTSEILRILIAVLTCVLDAEDRLLLVEAFPFSKETIFVHTDTKEVRLAYLRTKQAEGNGKLFLKELIESIAALYQEEQWRACAQELLYEIGRNSKGSLELIKYFREKAREVNLRGWPNEELERTVEAEGGFCLETSVNVQDETNKKTRFSFYSRRK